MGVEDKRETVKPGLRGGRDGAACGKYDGGRGGRSTHGDARLALWRG